MFHSRGLNGTQVAIQRGILPINIYFDLKGGEVEVLKNFWKTRIRRSGGIKHCKMSSTLVVLKLAASIYLEVGCKDCFSS